MSYDDVTLAIKSENLELPVTYKVNQDLIRVSLIIFSVVVVCFAVSNWGYSQKMRQVIISGFKRSIWNNRRVMLIAAGSSVAVFAITWMISSPLDIYDEDQFMLALGVSAAWLFAWIMLPILLKISREQ